MPRHANLNVLNLSVLSLILGVFVLINQSTAQDGRGDRERDGDRGREGDRGRGGFSGGGFPGGGPGGGFPGGPGGFSPVDMLRRFDENGNGLIDPEEAQGRASFFLQRIASEVPGIDLSRPVPIDKLAQGMERLRQQRESGGGDRGDSRGSPPSTSTSGRGATPTTVEPLVPGFGVPDTLPPVAGFGTQGELFAVQLTPADLREGEERLRRYDTNGDGVLDKDEIAKGRWSDDPLSYDRNHDGKLTAAELAVRYARRRLAEETNRTAAPANSGRPGEVASTRGPSDRGGFGRGGFPGGPGGPGDEQRNFFSRREGDSSNNAAAPATGGKVVDTRNSYRVKTVVERLPKGLPDWFARSDTNADGQVAMAEFSTNWTDAVLRDFQQFDLNNDGMITPSEAVDAVKNGAVRGATVTSSVSVNSRTTSTSGSAPLATANATPPTTAVSTSSGEPRNIDARTLAYYQKLLAKYDTNGDSFLVVDEWKVMSKDPAAADTDGDGRISVEEYIIWATKR